MQRPRHVLFPQRVRKSRARIYLRGPINFGDRHIELRVPARWEKQSLQGRHADTRVFCIFVQHTFDGDHHPTGALTTLHMQMNIKFRNQIWLILSQKSTLGLGIFPL